VKADWTLFANVAWPVALLVIGALINRYFERRPKLITYYGHTSAFRLRTPEQSEVFTHSIVIRNAGRKSASNIAVGHNFFPRDYQIFPAIAHEIRKVPDSADEIFIPLLVPGEQITISYLYWPPVTYAQVNTYVKSDDGFAKVLRVIPTPQSPKWVLATIWALVTLGAITALYFLSLLIRHMYTAISV
jgi:hypothetical protein